MAAADTSLERLYDVMKKIEDNKKSGKLSENSNLFKVILQAVKGDSTSKRLASQFIARLFKDFPDEQKTAYNALIDLVEDEDTLVRRQVISDLPKLCKDLAGYAPKVADVLVQVLQADDSQELALANQALLHVINAHPAEALSGILDQMSQPDMPELIRERAIRLLANRVQQMPLSAKLEELLVERLQPMIDSAGELEFASLVQLLASLSCMQTLTGRQRLLDTVGRKAGLNGPFQPADAGSLAKLRECIKQALPLLSKNINAKPFVIYFLDKVVPAIDKVPAEQGDQTPRLDLLKSFAELSGHAGGNFSATEAQLSGLLRRLTDRLPLPSDADVDTDADTPEAAVAAADAANLTQSECLLYAFHQAAKTRPEFLTDSAERLADLRKRLQLLHISAQAYQRSHKPAAGESKCRLADNIGALMKDLFRNPPTYKAELTLSWKPLPPPPPTPAATPKSAPAANQPQQQQQRKRPASQQDWGRGGAGRGGAGGYGKRGAGFAGRGGGGFGGYRRW